MPKTSFKNPFKQLFSSPPTKIIAMPSSSSSSASFDNDSTSNHLSMHTNSIINERPSPSRCSKCCLKGHSQSHHYLYHQTRYNLNYFLKIKLKPCAISLSIILLYYLFSITLTFYNRMLFVTYKYPLSITIIHLIIKFLISMMIRNCVSLCTSQPRIVLNWSMYVNRIIPTGIASALDIGLSNWSLEYITVALYTMSKSTVILFIVLFALLFKLEKWHWSLALVGFFISVGLLLFTYHSTEFHVYGFVLVMLASFSSGLRWTLAQMVTQKHEIGLSNPIDMMYHIQPGMILALLPLAVYVEGVSLITTDKFFRNEDLLSLASNTVWILLGAFLAFLLESSEYLVVSHTSSLTLSISGIFKEICTMYIAVKINDNRLNTINTIGLAICLFGIIVHVIIKARQQAAKPNEEEEKDKATSHHHYRLNSTLKRSQGSFNSSFEMDEYSHSSGSNLPLLSNQVY